MIFHVDITSNRGRKFKIFILEYDFINIFLNFAFSGDLFTNFKILDLRHFHHFFFDKRDDRLTYWIFFVFTFNSSLISIFHHLLFSSWYVTNSLIVTCLEFLSAGFELNQRFELVLLIEKKDFEIMQLSTVLYESFQ